MAAKKKGATARRAKTRSSPKKTSAAEPRAAAKSPARRARHAPLATPRHAREAIADFSIFPCTDADVRAATGRGWGEWLRLLDVAGAGALDSARVAELALQWMPAPDDGWARTLGAGYERARGRAGAARASFARVLPVPLFAAFAAWADETLRGGWLEAPGLDFTDVDTGRAIRARWPDGTELDVRFSASGPEQCEIVLESRRLADGSAARAETFWRGQFERLQAYLGV